MIKEKNNDLKNMLIGIGVIFLYLFLSAYAYDFLRIFGINFNSLSDIGKQLYLIIYEIFMLILIAYIYRKTVIPDLKDFKVNITKYFKKYIWYWPIMMLLMLISNIIITRFTSSITSGNEQIILDEFHLLPIYIVISTVLILPIVEELVFRLSIRKMIPKTNIVYIIISGLIFGAMHVVGTLSTMSDLLFIIPYSIPGFIFAYIYTKSDNIFVPISIHILHNLLMIIIQFILILI